MSRWLVFSQAITESEELTQPYVDFEIVADSGQEAICKVRKIAEADYPKIQRWGIVSLEDN